MQMNINVSTNDIHVYPYHNPQNLHEFMYNFSTTAQQTQRTFGIQISYNFVLYASFGIDILHCRIYHPFYRSQILQQVIANDISINNDPIT